ncbi:MAG: PEGA domain-containing protein [Pirellulales bacterium]|nr:PEGA domain-containing protein [Pirellulales bacterium]
MNAVLTCLAVLSAAVTAQVESTETPASRIYVRTVPQGAQIVVDGQKLGASDGLFLVPAGVRKLTIEMDGYDPQTRRVDVRDGWITRVVVELKKKPGETDASKKPDDIEYTACKPEWEQVLSHGDASAEGYRSLGGSGHAVKFERTKMLDYDTVVGVDIFASRYGDPEPPREDFHVYVLDEQGGVLRDAPHPYSKIKRGGDMQWYRLNVPPTRVGERFTVALSFNPHRTKGIYLGYDSDIAQSHSYTGLPDRGFSAVPDKYDWMVRVHLKRSAGAPAAPPDRATAAPSADPPSGDDPFAGPPRDPKEQAVFDERQTRGREVMQKMIERNLCWLIGPPDSVKSYTFRYTLGADPPKEYAVPDAAKARSGLLMATTYYSPLHALVDSPEDATFDRVEVGPEMITLEYTLAEPIDAAYGNGIEGFWRGYFQRPIGRGTLVLDGKTLAPQVHRLGEVTETFSDFAKIDENARVPLRIQIDSEALDYDWRFAVYEPGLWILKEGFVRTDDEAMKSIAKVEILDVNHSAPRVRWPAPAPDATSSWPTISEGWDPQLFEQ